MTETDEPAGLPPRRRRLLFRALHRGTKECDLLLGGFVQRHIARLDEAGLAELETILELPDVDLADWLSGRRPLPEEVAGPLLRRIAAESSRPGAGRSGPAA